MIAKERISFLLMKWRRLGEKVRGIFFSNRMSVTACCLGFYNSLQD